MKAVWRGVAWRKGDVACAGSIWCVRCVWGWHVARAASWAHARIRLTHTHACTLHAYPHTRTRHERTHARHAATHVYAHTYATLACTYTHARSPRTHAGGGSGVECGGERGGRSAAVRCGGGGSGGEGGGERCGEVGCEVGNVSLGCKASDMGVTCGVGED